MIETIKSFLDNNFFVCGIFIDLKKAFDTVDHKILTDKLLHYGIRGNANEWIKSFLENRKQFVSINGFESELKSVKCGVPQGSTLGPLLFLIYVNDLYQSFKKNIIHHFADDTNLIYASKKIATLENDMNYELKILVEWLFANKLTLNIAKTKLLMFQHPHKQIPNFSIKLNKVKLNLSNSVKYLGIVIDNKLSWNQQIRKIATKLNRANGILSKIRHYVSKETCISVYYSLFFHTLSMEVWYGHLLTIIIMTY